MEQLMSNIGTQYSYDKIFRTFACRIRITPTNYQMK